MKTALQELLDELDLIKIVENHNLFMVKYIIEQCLEKEKEQLLNAFRADSWNKSFNEYYNQTYNQNK